MGVPGTVATEVDKNYEAFQALLPEIIAQHAGQFALLHRGRVVAYFESSLSATLSGLQKFGEGKYSVQEVTAEPEHLGFYSYVGGTGQC